jgi:hypothetical protein
MLNKMKGILVTIFFILLTCVHNSCKNVSESNHIENAEKHIVNFNYEDALYNYDNADTLFSADCWNALLCAVKIKKWTTAAYWCKELIQRGVKITFFKQRKFDEFRKTKSWKQLEKDYTVYRDSFENTFILELKNSLIDLDNEDQVEYCGLQDQSNNLISAFESSKSIDSRVTYLLNKYGAFSEKKIGANIVKDTILSNSPIYFSILRHSFQSDSKLFFNSVKEFVDSNTMLKKEIFENSRSEPMSKNVLIKVNEFYYESTSDSFNDNFLFYKKKLIFNQCYNEFGFILFAPYNVLNFKEGFEPLDFNVKGYTKTEIHCDDNTNN